MTVGPIYLCMKLNTVKYNASLLIDIKSLLYCLKMDNSHDIILQE